jgi:hypothetical protein
VPELKSELKQPLTGSQVLGVIIGDLQTGNRKMSPKDYLDEQGPDYPRAETLGYFAGAVGRALSDIKARDNEQTAEVNNIISTVFIATNAFIKLPVARAGMIGASWLIREANTGRTGGINAEFTKPVQVLYEGSWPKDADGNVLPLGGFHAYKAEVGADQSAP